MPLPSLAPRDCAYTVVPRPCTGGSRSGPPWEVTRSCKEGWLREAGSGFCLWRCLTGICPSGGGAERQVPCLPCRLPEPAWNDRRAVCSLYLEHQLSLLSAGRCFISIQGVLTENFFICLLTSSNLPMEKASFLVFVYFLLTISNEKQ